MIVNPLISRDFPEQKFSARDPENLCPYGPQNHPLPPFKPKNDEIHTGKAVGKVQA